MSRASRAQPASRAVRATRIAVTALRSAFPVIALVVGAVAAVAQGADSAATIERGRRIYMSVGCYQCHGTVGQGGTAGPRLAPGPMPLEALRVFLRNTARAMPAYPETVLTDAAIADLHAYLESIPPSPRAESLPALRDLK